MAITHPVATDAERAAGLGTAEGIVNMGDLGSYPALHRILEVDAGDRSVRLIWDDGRVSEFHYIWLRDACACQLCRHAATLERIFDPLSFPADIRATHVDVLSSGALRLQWPDEGHVSLFDPGWLRVHCYSEAARAERIQARKPTTWGAEIADRLPTFACEDILSDAAALLSWLHALRDVGIALVRGVPAEPGAVEGVAQRISYLRQTNFGVSFEVYAMPKPNNNAYTALALPLHTDLPNWEMPPGYQFLHCLANEAIGGDSLLSDGFKLAEVLREQDPQAFELLSSLPMNFRFQDETCDIRFRTPAITVNCDGEITEIRLNFHLTTPLDIPPDKVEAMTRAYRKLIALTREPGLQLRLRLSRGDLIVFHNRRILHARTAFDPSSGLRHLRGCYVDADDLLSKIRVLERGTLATTLPQI